MKALKNILLNIKSAVPYLCIIFIYFFFINIQARKEDKSIQPQDKQINNTKNGGDNFVLNKKVSIPVFPYQDNSD